MSKTPTPACVVEPLERRTHFAGGPPGFVVAVTNPPAAFVAADGATVKLAVTIANHGTFWPIWPITVFASTDATLDDTADVPVASAAPKGALLTGRQKTFKLAASFANVPDGTYRLIVRAQDPNDSYSLSNPAVSPASTPVVVATPFADLAISLHSVPVPLNRSAKHDGFALFDVTSAGNADFTGNVTLDASLLPEPGGDPILTLAPVTRTLHLKPGRRKTLKVKLTGSHALAADTYTLTAALSSNGSPPDANAANDSVENPVIVGPTDAG